MMHYNLGGSEVKAVFEDRRRVIRADRARSLEMEELSSRSCFGGLGFGLTVHTERSDHF